MDHLRDTKVNENLECYRESPSTPVHAFLHNWCIALSIPVIERLLSSFAADIFHLSLQKRSL